MQPNEQIWYEVLSGSQLDGPSQSIEDWVGITVPEGKWDQYVDLVGGAPSLRALIERTKHGAFEIVEEEEDRPPGMNDTYWVVTSDDEEKLKCEIRTILINALGLRMA